MKGSAWRGYVFTVLLNSAVGAGHFLLCCPLFPLFFINEQAFREVINIVFSAIDVYSIALLDTLFKPEVFISGDFIVPWEKSLILINHKTRLDGLFVGMGMYYAVPSGSHRLKFVAKDSLRHLPGFGWMMQMNGNCFIKRNIEKDKDIMSHFVDRIRHDHNYQILMLPEGTNLTAKTLMYSNAYADRKQLQRYSHVLHPRTKGFALLVKKLRQVKGLHSIYDLTTGMRQTQVESEMDMIKGFFPEEIHINVDKILVDELPQSDADVEEWLKKRWALKQTLLERFNTTGSFPTNKTSRIPNQRPVNSTFFVLITFWTTAITSALYLFFTSHTFQIYVVFNVSFFIILSFTPKGFTHIELIKCQAEFKCLLISRKRRVSSMEPFYEDGQHTKFATSK